MEEQPTTEQAADTPDERPDDEPVDYKQRLADAAHKYRDLLLASAPEIPAELVSGDTVEEVDASFAAARGVVEEVRRRMEAQANAERVPAGAPPRTAPDLSGLSPAEKIAFALSQQG